MSSAIKFSILFDVKIPTKDFKKSMDELDNKKGKSFNSVDDLFEDLDK